MQTYSIGTRISYQGHLATIRFIGTVDNTTGIWLGVEWDDPSRGKHDGVKDGKRYFSCRIPNAGSFIRTSANVLCGVSFLEGLSSKYIESFHGTNTQEKVILGSSNGAIEVEAVNLDKIRGKFSDLGRLREVSLENELIARPDPPGAIQKTCPNIRGLDLSTTLLPTWRNVADISVELIHLQRLALNRTRLTLLYESQQMATGFLNLLELQLNGSLTTWQQFQEIIPYMPKLRAVELGYNHLSDLSGSSAPESQIQTLNFDNNELFNWNNIWDTLGTFTHLERVVLSSNGISDIPVPQDHQCLAQLKHVSLSYNHLNSWKDIDALSLWFPSLTSLSISENPVVDGSAVSRYSRQFLIARIASLTILDVAAISVKERVDSELFYLSYIAQHSNFDSGTNPHETILQEHPRWDVLCQKHGTPEHAFKRTEKSEKLSSKLFEVKVHRVMGPSPKNHCQEHAEVTALRVLPTMTLKLLRLKIRKLMKVPPRDEITVWVKMPDGQWVELETDRDQQDLDWLGLENGSQVACCIFSTR
ncbi:hypothetical protein L218DRAFT_870040 [Marasmius fiardii PR-910]|nr:hypothetical protein L218DRAFT_870040 [Marasmius fiardii PR-910]